MEYNNKTFGFLYRLKQSHSTNEFTLVERYYELNLFEMTFCEKLSAKEIEVEEMYGYKQMENVTWKFKLEESKVIGSRFAIKLHLKQGEDIVLVCKTFKDFKFWISSFHQFFKKIYFMTYGKPMKSFVLSEEQYIYKYIDTFANSFYGKVPYMQVHLKQRSKSTDAIDFHIDKLKSKFSLGLTKKFLEVKFLRINRNRQTKKFKNFALSVIRSSSLEKLFELYIARSMENLYLRILNYNKPNGNQFIRENIYDDLDQFIAQQEKLKSAKSKICADYLRNEAKLFGRDIDYKVQNASNLYRDIVTKIKHDINREFSSTNIEMFLNMNKNKILAAESIKVNQAKPENSIRYVSRRNQLNNSNEVDNNQTRVRLIREGKGENFTMEFTVKSDEKQGSKPANQTQRTYDRKLLFKNPEKTNEEIDKINFFDNPLNKVLQSNKPITVVNTKENDSLSLSMDSEIDQEFKSHIEGIHGIDDRKQMNVKGGISVIAQRYNKVGNLDDWKDLIN